MMLFTKSTHHLSIKYLFFMIIGVYSFALFCFSENNVFWHFVNRLFGFKVHSGFEISNFKLSMDACLSKQKVLYGVFTTLNKVVTRNILRRYGKMCKLNGETYKTVFVVGKPKTHEDYEILINEMELHNDIFVLSCEENMNEGKTFFFFKEAAKQMSCFDYYAKVDDDTAFVPQSISGVLMDDPGERMLYIGRAPDSVDTNPWWIYVKLYFKWNLRDMMWVYDVKSYHAGMLYILSKQAVTAWINLNATDLYGDEDYRTSYYMTKVGSTMLHMDTKFHDYWKYVTWGGGHWKRNITNESLAIHQCKKPADYSSALLELCSVHANQ